MRLVLENSFDLYSRAYARVDWVQEAIPSIIITEFALNRAQVWHQPAMINLKLQAMLNHIQIIYHTNLRRHRVMLEDRANQHLRLNHTRHVLKCV